MLDLALGLVEQASLIPFVIGAPPRGNLPDYLTIFVLLRISTPMYPRSAYTAFSSQCSSSALGDLGHVRGRVVNVMSQGRLHIDADIRLHFEEVLVTLCRLVHIWIMLAILVFSRAGRMSNYGVDAHAVYIKI